MTLARHPIRQSVRAKPNRVDARWIDNMMHPDRPTVTRATARRLCCLSVIVLLMTVACSNSKEDSAESEQSLFAQIKSQVDPVAEVTAGVAVAKLSNEGSSSDPTTAEMLTAHASTVRQLEDSLCKTLQDASKDVSGEQQERLRAIANQALRDSFVLKFIQAAAATSPERQTEIVKILDIKSISAEGTPLEGGAALKDASLTTSQGTLQIPPTDSPEYTKYTDWLVNNPALSGFATVTLTEDYAKAIRKCSLG